MNKLILLLFLGFGPFGIEAQSLFSTGLPKAALWYVAAAESGQSTTSDGVLNFWQSPLPTSIPAASTFPLPADVNKQATIFSVYHPNQQGSESALWTLETPDKAPLVCTDKRIADLESVSYLNWENLGPQWRIGSTWFQNGKRNLSDKRPILTIGQAPQEQSLPLSPTPGNLVELILFPTVLSPGQRLQVETYLALKYGITLGSSDHPQNYILANKKVIWDGEGSLKKWHHRVFGIGKDSSNHWEQFRSTSALEPDLLTLNIVDAPPLNGMPGPELPNCCYWLTGDNDLPLEWTSSGPHQQLNRNWILKTIGSTSDIPTEMRLDLGKWLLPGESFQNYRLLIDRSGSGQFLAGDTETIAPSSFSKGQFAHFAGIIWDPDGSGEDVYTFIRTTPPSAENPGQALRLYPNPVSAGQSWQWQFRLAQSSSLELRIYNSAGQLLRSEKLGEGDYFSKEERPLAAGIYLLEFTFKHQVYSQKLAVQ